MKGYQCHKVVEAAKIIQMVDEGGDELSFIVDHIITVDDASGDDQMYEVVKAPKNILSRYEPQDGDYLVKYEDGYLSISPCAAFEAGYSLLLSE